MRFALGVSVWCKADMVAWLLDGIATHCAPTTQVIFHFDACSDGSEEAFRAMKNYWLTDRGFPEPIVLRDEEEVREVGGHDRIIQAFLRTDGELLAIYQDDQRLGENIEAVATGLFVANPKLGIIGGRDGYERGYANMVKSPWSLSVGGTALAHGSCRQVSYVNSGPIVYPRRTLEEVGSVDREFNAFYIWDDYAARCLAAGRQNVLYSTRLDHAKFGRVKASQVYVPAWSAADRARLRAKHRL